MPRFFFMRKNYTWKLSRASIELGPRTAIMGIINLTPDSFSDGGLYNDTERAVDRALEIETEGADILDIGGQSTRPKSGLVDAAEEAHRVIPTLERIAASIKIRFPSTPTTLGWPSRLWTSALRSLTTSAASGWTQRWSRSHVTPEQALC